MALSPTFLLLQKEGYLIRSCLTTGLTALRNSKITDRGQFYTAFFQLAIGVERLMKTAIIINHMVDNNLTPPGSSVLKRYGHDLVKLFSVVKDLEQKRERSFTDEILPVSLEYKILEFLAEFARGTRYYNLDALTFNSSSTDPLKAWNQLIIEILEKDVSKKQKQRIIEDAHNWANIFEGSIFAIYYDLDDRQLPLDELISKPKLHELAARYSVFYVLKLLCPLKQFLEYVTYLAYKLNSSEQRESRQIPEMKEFLNFIWIHDKSRILRKKRWV